MSPLKNILFICKRSHFRSSAVNLWILLNVYRDLYCATHVPHSHFNKGPPRFIVF